MEQKFKMQIQRLAKACSGSIDGSHRGHFIGGGSIFTNSNPVYGAENGIYLAGCQSKLS